MKQRRIFKKVIVIMLAVQLLTGGLNVKADETYKNNTKTVNSLKTQGSLNVTTLKLQTGFVEKNKRKFVTVEKAADKVRAKVRNHTSSVTVYFKCKMSSPVKAYMAFKKELTKETDNSNEGDYMYWGLASDSPQYTRVKKKEGRINYYYYKFKIGYKYYITAKQQKLVDSKIRSIIKSFDFQSNTTDYEKVKTIYEYICANVSYATDLSNNKIYTAYSALYKKQAVCQGYAQLLYKMLKEVDIPVRLIPGYSGGELHGWNIVKLGKYYYNLDATWDAVTYQKGLGYKFFLKGDNFSKHTRMKEYKSATFYNKYLMAAKTYGTDNQTMSKKSVISRYKMKKGKILSAKSRKIKMKSLPSGTTYIVEYGTDKSFKNNHIVNTRKKTVKLNKISSGRTYYVRYRGVKSFDGTRVYTKWSNVKTVK